MEKSRMFYIVPWMLALFLFSCSAGLELKKKQGEASRNLGEAYINQGNYTAALKELLKAESLYPNDPYLHNDLGIVYMAKEKPELAIKHLKKSVQLNPEYAPARNNLGAAYMANKNWDDAIVAFQKVSEDLLYATPHYPLANMALCYYNKQEYDLAKEHYLKALKLDPAFLIALKGLGRTYLAMGKTDDSIETFEKALDKAPRYADVYFDLGKAYAMKNNKEKALDAYRKFIELSPDAPLAEEAEKEVEKLSSM